AVASLALVLSLFLWFRPGGGTGRPPQLKLSQITIGEGVEDFPAVSPDSRRVAYASDSGAVRHIVLKDLQSGKEEPLTRGDFDEIQPAWDPDGGTILFVRARKPASRLEPGDIFGQYTGGDVWARDLHSNRETKLTENAFDPAPSP